MYDTFPQDNHILFLIYSDRGDLLSVWDRALGIKPYTHVRPKPVVPPTAMVGTKVYLQAWGWPVGGVSNVVEVEVVL